MTSLPLKQLLCQCALCLAISGGSQATAASPQTQLADEIARLSEYKKIGHRLDAKVEGCVFHSRRWDPLPEGGEVLVGIASADLQTAAFTVPLTFRMRAKVLQEEGKPVDFLRNGSWVVDLDEGPEAGGAMEISGSDAFPIIREESVLRERTQSYIRSGDTRPSPRGDGKSYVFRDSTRLFIAYDQPGGGQQLRALEAALIEYQQTYCQNLS
ncbi:hypothetical protein [Leisingera sp. ANG-Vp]|uniref:hypothetical protein n=1 Tax=Leisingera sp. ANG-Vp TaxID=1577896 RepID=UPI00057E07EF|nr:hypothetical protein [Leisingera sp. ANG-Vp]KIC21607.1 hypothetical protein RA20_03030 [Leisingera sp. ANG-Vp]